VTLKHSELPIIGVNTFLSSKGSPTIAEVIRATEEEKKIQIKTLENLQKANAKEVQQRLDAIQMQPLKMKTYLTT
jgi:methylmalonyl-CoA mutase